MKTAVKILLCLAGSMVSLLAQAQIYMCKDANGRTITSDRPIPECADRAVREYGKGGELKRDIPPPPTAEEKRQKKLQEEKQKAEAAAAEEQKKSDNLLLARYPNEEAIETARKRTLEIVQEQLKRDTAALTAAEKQLKQAQAEMDSYKKKQAKPPADLGRKIEDAESTAKDSKRRIKEHEAEIAQINAKFDQALKRFKEITVGAAGK